MNTAASPASAPRLLVDRLHLVAFVGGCIAVTIGVLMHIPMYWMGRMNHFRLVGMPMGWDMYLGMALIIGGLAVAAYGLLPRRSHAAHSDVSISPPEDAPLTPAHWGLMLVLIVALVIDVMKPATLGWVLPGMMKEYGVSKETVAWFPLSALTGTFIGSILWGILADAYGRRASILLSAVMFMGTSICGAMPSLWWNVGMCFLMGLAAGGLLPVAYALLAEIMPTRHRGWALVLVGGLGGIGGYFAASELSGLLQPVFSWRIMWFLNLPTGMILVLMSHWIPESAKFLISQGFVTQAHKILKRFGSVASAPALAEETHAHGVSAALADHAAPPIERKYLAKTLALTVAGLSWSLINFGLLLWLPNDLVAKGYDVAGLGKKLAASALIALPTVFAASFLYSRWSTKWSLAASLAITVAGLVWVLMLDIAPAHSINPVFPIALLIVGSNALLAILLPYTAENYPLRVRGRATGWVAGCSKLGGLVVQGVAIVGAVPPLWIAAAAMMGPTVLGLILVSAFGDETRGHDLREIDEEDLGFSSARRVSSP